jgi:hypothetical protein
MVEAPECIDLDAEPWYLAEILDGTFMNFTCASCGKLHKPEFPLTVRWPGKASLLEVIPEADRLFFYRQKKEKNRTGEMVIGYPELAERLAILRDGLEPMTVEALKYYLYLKGEEHSPEEIAVWYHRHTPDTLEFYLRGVREDAIGVTQIPQAVYENILGDYKKRPKAALFRALRTGRYLSVKNLMFPGTMG